MNDEMSDTSEYIHGSSLEEQHRLSLLNEILNESCLRELNLQPGEKVLDIGSGLGQFTRLMAQDCWGSGGCRRDRARFRSNYAGAQSWRRRSGEAGLVEFREGDADGRCRCVVQNGDHST